VDGFHYTSRNGTWNVPVIGDALITFEYLPAPDAVSIVALLDKDNQLTASNQTIPGTDGSRWVVKRGMCRTIEDVLATPVASPC